MKRVFNYILMMAFTLTLAASCWKEPVFEKDTARADRHEVTNLKAVAGDGEVALTWSLPEGLNASEFIVFYTDAQAGKIVLRTGSTETKYTVTNLKNGVSYIFNVQAVYGDVISGAVSVGATPLSTRFAVTNLLADAESGKVTLYWTAPVSDKLTGYVITYTKDGENFQTKEINDKNAVSCVIEGLTDDVTYTFTVVAKYSNGNSDPVSVSAMPAFAVPYKLESELTAVGLPITFTFNREDYPSATDVKWTFPDGTVLTGDEVKGAFYSPNPAAVAVLSAKVNGLSKTWNISINVREFVINDNDFPCDGSNYNGFKGGAPMFSPDGKTVYNLTFNKITNVMAYDILSGAKKWTYTVNHSSYNGLTVNPVTGDIYFGTTTSGDFFALSPDGNLRWQFTEAGSMQSASPAVSADGSVVFIIDAQGNTFALDAATGAKKWNVSLGAKGAGLLVNGNDLVVLVNGTSKTINWLNASTGETIVSYDQKIKPSDICGGFAVSPDKKYAYYGHNSGAVSKIDLAERKILVDAKVIGTNNMWGVVVSPNGDVFFGSKESKAFLVDGDQMELKATFDPGIGSNNGFNYARACSDTDGNFYVSTGQIQNMNYVLSHELTVKDSFQIPGDGNKQMGGNNYLDGILYASYIGKNGDNGRFVGKYVGGKRYMAYGIDICGSCCIK